MPWTQEDRSFPKISSEKSQEKNHSKDTQMFKERGNCRDQDSNLGYCGHNAGSSPLDDRGYHSTCQEKYQHDNGQSNHSRKIAVTWTPT